MLSIVVYGRNDNHGYNLHKRVALSINCFAEILQDPDDEILFVDYNTPDEHPSLIETIQDTLTEKARRTVRIIRAYPSVHRPFADKTPFPVIESIARNIGFRRTNPANKWVLSTNTDMILVPRTPGRSFNDILKGLKDGFYLLPRFELPEALWELVDRAKPSEVIARVGKWGMDFAINEVINRPLVRYDAPGDFQLALRRDLFALSGMDERMLLGNVHVDSNLCRRMVSLHGELSSLIDNMFGYHCAHTRTATMVHGRNKISNDFERFVREIKDWRIDAQAETWGLPGGVIEEITLPRQGAIVERVLSKVITPLDKPFEEINWGSGRREALRYSVDHMMPFLASSMAPLPKEYSLGLAVARPDVLAKVLQLWIELGFKGQVGMRQEDLRRFSQSASFASLPLATNIRPCTEDEFLQDHDLFLFEFGLAAEAHAEGEVAAPVELDGDQLSAVQEVLERFIVVERERTLLNPPRRAMFIGAANNRFEPLVNDNFDVTHTPFTSRVRQGFLHVAPQDRKRTNFDPRELAVAIQKADHRSNTPPTDEIVRMWAEIQDFIRSGSANFLVTRAHRDLLRVARAHNIAGADVEQAEQAISSLDQARLSNTKQGHITAKLLDDDEPVLPRINKLADPRDWENAEWWRMVSRFFGGSDSYSSYNRHRDVWLQAQMLHALRGFGLNSKANVLVVTTHSDDGYAALSQLAGHVSVCRSAFEPVSPLDRVDRQRWLDVPVLPRSGRITFLDQGLPNLPGAAYDFVIFTRNSAQDHGPYGLIRALENAQRVVKPGGYIVAALDVDVGGALRELAISNDNLAQLLIDIDSKGGLELVDRPDYRLSKDALDLMVNADTEMHRPHFVRARRGGYIAAGMAALRKRDETSPEMWTSIRQSRISWLVGSINNRLEVSEPFRLLQDGVRVEWDDPDGVFARVPRISLPPGRYVLPLTVTPDTHVPDGRKVVGVEIEGPNDIPLLLRDVGADEARKGEVLLPFTVSAAPGQDAIAVSVRLRNFGRAGFVVETGNIRPREDGDDARSSIDLIVRNAVGPNAWRRGEEIVVERDAEKHHFLYGPYQRLQSGWWRLQLSMSATDVKDEQEPIAELEILHGSAGRLPPAVRLTPARLHQGPVTIDIYIPTSASEPAGFAGAFEVRLQYKGGARIILNEFSLTATDGPTVEDTWSFTLHGALDHDTQAVDVWLPATEWMFASGKSGNGQFLLSAGASTITSNFEEGVSSRPIDLRSFSRDGWTRLEASLTGQPHLMAQPVKDLFDGAGAPEDWHLGQGPGVDAFSEVRRLDQIDKRKQSDAPALYISAASLMGSAFIPERSPRAIDPLFKLAGSRSIERARSFVKRHKFDTARVDFADLDYSMQSLPRLRRVLAMKSWLDLFKEIRKSSGQVIVEIHQIEHRRQGPRNSDLLRRRLFGIADEIVLHDEAALQTMRHYFPEMLPRVSMAAQWVASQ